jgi:hypothetical protein
MRDAEEFWEKVLAQIEGGQVIPVVTFTCPSTKPRPAGKWLICRL